MLKKVTDWVTCDLMEVLDWREKVMDGRMCNFFGEIGDLCEVTCYHVGW